MLIKDIEESIELLCKHNSVTKEQYKQYMKSHYHRIAADADFITKLVSKDSKILDIGAIPPLFTELLRRQGFKNISIADPMPEQFETYFIETGIKSIKLDLLNASAENLKEQYDLVCLNEVVEHIAGNLLSALKNAIDCVKPGGYFFVTTPNQRSISGVAALVFKNSGLASKPGQTVLDQFNRATAQYGYYGHIREYTFKEVIDLIEAFDLKFIKMELQGEFRKHTRYMKFISVIEKAFPKWRLFGKYLFQKKAS